MSKINLNQLNTSELETLNTEATGEVVGGSYGYWGGYYNSHYSKYSSKFAAVQQGNVNSNNQVAFGGGAFSNTSNHNSNSQNNSANIYQ